MKFIAALGMIAFLCGCAKTELSNEDIEAQRKEFSKENYEKAMKSAGKGDAIAEQNRDSAERQRDEQSR